MNLRTRVLPFLLLLLSVLPLRAQIERQLATQTDLLDVYVKNSGKSEMVAIFDFTTPSRGIFESKQYLTGKTRGSFTGANQPADTNAQNPYVNLFKPATLGKDFGMVFAVYYDAASIPAAPAPATNLGVSNIKVRMLRWPQSTPYTTARFSDIVGIVNGVPYQFRDDGTQNLVSWDVATDGAWDDVTSPRIIASRTTHIRFRITATAAVVRTIDLPCPSQFWNSPHAADTLAPRTPADKTARNFSRTDTGTGIKYDPWSEANLINTATPVYLNGANKRTVLGNFFYSFDYLAWIFGSKKVRNADSSDWIAAGANTTPLYGVSTGYAVPQPQDDVRATTSGGVVKGQGWANGLPNVTRYQAVKSTAINVLLNFDGKINWVYRFLAPVYPGGVTDDGQPAEELGTATNTGGIPANDPSQTSTKLRFLRKLTSAQLAANNTSLQVIGPSNWKPTNNNRMDIFEFGAFDNYDPRSPMPWSYALANTYYRTAIERDPAVFDPPVAGCPGRTYVVLFPIHSMNDSKTAALDQITGEAFADYFHTGNSGLGKGSKAELPAETATVPGTEGFNTGILSSLAAFGVKAGSNNMAFWGAPWQQNPSTARSSDNPGIQTMSVSVGIPGSYKLQSDNNGRNPHEAYFRVAQWADPYRTDLTYGKWRKANGNPDDSAVVDGGKVHYYPSSDPAELQKNFDDLVAYIVAGSAALSAPATPSTGARITSQAFFGIFNTSRKPVWSGNLFAVGIDRRQDPATGEDIFTFYGADGEDTRPFTVDPGPPPVTTYGISDFDNHHLWSAYDIFGIYLPAEIPPLKPVYTAGVLGSPKLWSARTVYTEGAGGALINFDKGNGALVTALITEIDSAGLFAATVPDKTQDTKDFIDFIRGRNYNDATGNTNRIDIMGDIINSAPVAIELSQDRVAGLTSLSWPGGTQPHARLILVGTNMGQLHCFGEASNFDATNHAKAKATELWAFIPREAMLALYRAYALRGADDAGHLYIMDGDPVLYHNDLIKAGDINADTRVGAKEDAVVITGMRKGGRNYYAIAVSSILDAAVTPEAPKLVWKLVPSTSVDPTVQKMGMSSAIPISAFISTATSTKQPIVFIAGGYANDEVNDRYRAMASPPITATEGLGKQILGLNPVDGTTLRSWDFSGDANLGAIAGGVTPVRIFRTSPLIQRIYWADYAGNVLALNSTDTATSAGFRLDNDRLSTWIATPRYIRNASKNGGSPEMRFTNRPDAFRLSTNYPAPVKDSSGVIPLPAKVRPLTVMVSAGAGDRNNPADKDETYVVSATTYAKNPPKANYLYVWADRQDSSNLSFDADGIPDSGLEEITDNTSGGTNWATSYDTAVDPKASKVTPAHADFFWANDKYGYYLSLLDGSLPTAVGGVTRDKLLVSPLTKDGVLFFSLFNINGSTGFDCSANAFTRTFRECDITRPLALPTQVEALSTVDDINDLNKSEDGCNGLAFYFNSLSSQLADTGDRVVQGGATTSDAGSGDFGKQVGANTPKIDEIKATTANRGARLRAWRVVR